MTKKIMVVEDSPQILELECNMLRLLDLQPVPVSSGMGALRQLGEEKPDLVLLDVMLPDMDGFKICQHIKTNPSLSGIPVFMVSAKVTTEDLEQGRKAGADEYITKPFRATEIAELIASYLNKKT